MSASGETFVGAHREASEPVCVDSASGNIGERRPLDNVASFSVLGSKVNAVQIPQVIQIIEDWIAKGDSCHYVAVTGMHGIMEAHHNPEFKSILNEADLVVPDGMPLVWLGRMQGHHLRRRVYGPELMLAFCRATDTRGYRHFLYGGAPGVPEKLARSLFGRFPGFRLVGAFSPAFRPLSAEEDAEIVDLINREEPDVLWVGLSTPKQERWMREHRDRLRVPVMLGVGAAFDINSGTKGQAPRWMREHGLEWLFRLVQEPRRLWRRYVVYGAEFLFCILREQLTSRKVT